MTRVANAAKHGGFDEMARKMSIWVDHVLGRRYQKFHPADIWTPPINLCEDDTHYCMVVELAGVDAEAIDLRVDGGELVLSGERPMPRPDEAIGQVRVHLMEIDQGHFRRRVRLPADADVRGIQATYRNGYLRVRIPKER